jgi:hypothetical protein
MVSMMARTVAGLDDSLSLHGPFSTAVSGKFLEFDAKLDADKEDAVKALTAWNIDAFTEAVNDKCPGLDWAAVFSHLDTPELAVPSAKGLALIAAVHRQACRAPLPATVLYGKWSNGAAQLQLLSHALSSSKLDIEWAAGKRVESRDWSLPPIKPELSPWLSIQLTAALLGLSALGHYAQVEALFAPALL